jgi:hypothetical protein
VIYEAFCRGSCLGRLMEGRRVVVDTEAPVLSGDLVAVLYVPQSPEGRMAPRSITKQLEVTSDGRWWLCCIEGVTPIGKYFVPASVHPVISLRDLPYPPPSMPLLPEDVDATADEKTLGFWDKESLAARVEWVREGKPRGVPFPGLEAALLAGGTDWPESFRLPPNYFPSPGRSP